MATSTVTSKGQITIPKEIRDQLHLHTGNRIEFVVDPTGRLILTPRNKDFRSVKGLLRSKRKRPVSIHAMEHAIAQGSSKL